MDEQALNRRTSTCDAESRDHCHYAEKMAERAAEIALKKFSIILGVDLDKAESIEAFREDLRFGKKLRKAADHGFLTLFGVIAVAVAAAVWAGILSKINGGH